MRLTSRLTRKIGLWLLSIPSFFAGRRGRSDIKRRLEHAEKMSAQDVLIAAAYAFPQGLVVVSCAGDSFTVPWSDRVLSRVYKAERDLFSIAKHGSYMEWETSGTTVDLSILRRAVDLDLDDAMYQEWREHSVRMGKAIRTLRELHGIPPSEIPGVCEQLVLDIEDGVYHASYSIYKDLAKAHKMNLNYYLNRLAEIVQESREVEPAEVP